MTCSINIHSERLTDGSHVYNVDLVEFDGENRISLPAVDRAAAFNLAETLQTQIRANTCMTLIQVEDYTRD